MNLAGLVILGAIATEALVELLIHAEPLDRPRDWLMAKASFCHKLLSCGWCLSFWVALLVFAVIAKGWWIALIPLVIHRASNYVHDVAGLVEEKKESLKEREKKSLSQDEINEKFLKED